MQQEKTRTIYVVSGYGFGFQFEQFLQRILNAFKLHCVVIDNSSFIKLLDTNGVSFDNDVVIDFFSGESRVLASVKTENRICFICDERASSSEIAYTNRIKSFEQNGCKKVIVSYANKKHLQCLTDAGISHVYMPLVMPKKRSRTNKSVSVIATGSFEKQTYPTRAHLVTLINDISRTNIKTGYPCLNDDYLQMLDQAELGLVCCAGYRDRMLAKYGEYGACHILPVGDCPSYMPQEMKQIMVNVENMSDTQIKNEIDRLLTSDRVELYERQENYSKLCHEYFDEQFVGNAVYNDLLNNFHY